jgi:hypothetical protein
MEIKLAAMWNKTVFVVFAIFMGFAVSQASEPKPCYVSEVFTSGLSQTVILGHEGVEVNNGIVTLSIPSKQARYDILTGTINIGKESLKYEASIFVDFATNQVVVADPISQTCSTEPLSGPTGPGTIPPDSKYLGEIVVGSMTVHQFGYEIESSPYYYAVGLTTGSCAYYISEMYNNTSTPPSLVVSEAFYNFSPYVNPYSFDLPCYCSANMVPTSQMRPKIKSKYHSAILGLSQFFVPKY